MKNEGTQGNEWTGVGNFKLWYLGEEATAEALEEAAAYNAARVETLAKYLEESEGTEAENYSLAPGFGAVQMTTLQENGAATYNTYFDGSDTISTNKTSATKTTVTVGDTNFNTNNKIAVKNSKESTPETGVIFSILPYSCLLRP